MWQNSDNQLWSNIHIYMVDRATTILEYCQRNEKMKTTKKQKQKQKQKKLTLNSIKSLKTL